MSKQGEERISFIVVTYNNAKTIIECLSSILGQTCTPVEILVVDNNSQDSTASIVSAEFPTATLIQNSKNLGFGVAVNVAAQVARGDLIATVNPDAFLDNKWSQNVLQFLTSDQDCAAVEGKLLLADRPGFLNCAGSYVNVLGFGCPAGYGEADGPETAAKIVPYASGAALAVRRDVFLGVGGFDTSYFLYQDDVDLGLRIYAAGWHVHYVPTAVAHHHYKSKLTKTKVYYLELNRWRTLIKNMPIAYFLVCGPLIAISEVGIALKLVLMRLFPAKATALLEFLRSLPNTLAARRSVRESAEIPDAGMGLLTDDFPALIAKTGFAVMFGTRLMRAYSRAFLRFPAEFYTCDRTGLIQERSAP